jgi:hypothetical protein
MCGKKTRVLQVSMKKTKHLELSVKKTKHLELSDFFYGYFKNIELNPNGHTKTSPAYSQK